MVVQELFSFFHVVCHGAYAIFCAWPELKFVRHPSPLSWKVPISHSVNPFSYLGLDALELLSTSSSGAIRHSQSLPALMGAEAVYWLLGSIVHGDHQFPIHKLSGTLFALAAFIVQHVPETFFWLEASSGGQQ